MPYKIEKKKHEKETSWETKKTCIIETANYAVEQLPFYIDDNLNHILFVNNWKKKMIEMDEKTIKVKKKRSKKSTG